MGSKISNLEILELTPKIPQRLTTHHHSIQFKPNLNKISIIQTWPIPSTPIGHSDMNFELIDEEESSNKPKSRRLSSIYYASVDNMSEMESIDSESGCDDDILTRIDEMSDDENDKLFVSARKRTQSTSENFVLIIDRNLSDQRQASFDEFRDIAKSAREIGVRKNDVILNVLEFQK